MNVFHSLSTLADRVVIPPAEAGQFSHASQSATPLFVYVPIFGHIAVFMLRRRLVPCGTASYSLREVDHLAEKAVAATSFKNYLKKN